MESILQQFLKTVIVKDSEDKPLGYYISEQLQKDYNHEDAQKLFELARKVSICNFENKPLMVPKFDIVIPINTDIYFVNVNVLWFCYSVRYNIIMLIFTGTYNDMLYLIDLNYKHADPNIIHNRCENMKIHGGFLSLYEKIQPNILDKLSTYLTSTTQLIITGFSLGGAMSTLAILDLYKRTINHIEITNIIHYSFASPRLFNTIGAHYYDSLNLSSYRIKNDSDIIPSLPFPVMLSSLDSFSFQDFTHVKETIVFNINLGNYYDNHITAYMQYYNVD